EKHFQVWNCLDHVKKRGFNLLPDFVVPFKGGSLAYHDDYLWECAKWVPGESLDYQKEKSYLYNAFEVLADFHHALSTIKAEKSLASCPLLKRRSILNDFHEYMLKVKIREIESDFMKEVVHLMAGLLPVVLPKFERINDSKSVQWCWGDSRLANFIFNNQKVVGIIDFEAMKVNPLEADFARLMADFEPWEDSNWQKALKAYDDFGSLDVSLAKFYCLSGLACALVRWAKWLTIPCDSIQLNQQRLIRGNEILERLNKWKKHGFETRAF
ncbi:MAG: aminoglycoside phosphotransferase family protein, partial [Planctomycetia bacterium]